MFSSLINYNSKRMNIQKLMMNTLMILVICLRKTRYLHFLAGDTAIILKNVPS